MTSVNPEMNSSKDLPEQGEAWKQTQSRFQEHKEQYLSLWKSLSQARAKSHRYPCGFECINCNMASIVPENILEEGLSLAKKADNSLSNDDGKAVETASVDSSHSSISGDSTVVKFDISFECDGAQAGATQDDAISLSSDDESVGSRRNEASVENLTRITKAMNLGDNQSIQNDSSSEEEWNGDFRGTGPNSGCDIDAASVSDDLISIDSIEYHQRRLSFTKRSKVVESRALNCENRSRLADEYFSEFDSVVFSGKLADKTTVEWVIKLRTTAGLTRMREVDGLRTATIQLSTKVLDCEDRLRHTLLHEMCHAATYIIDLVEKPGHGAKFWLWGNRAMKMLDDMEVSTRHDYDIDYKYVWKCQDCNSTVGRHSKSLDIDRKVCGKCHGRFVQVKPKPRTNSALSAYNLFIKDNLPKVRLSLAKKSTTGKASQADVMKECARLWKLRNPSE